VDLADRVLGSERLTLRPWRRTDAPAVHEAMPDRATHEFLVLPDPAGGQQCSVRDARCPRYRSDG
jgi:hypothetical protein